MIYKNVFTPLFLVVFSIVFFVKTGTITSGFHFRDDQLYLEINNYLIYNGFWDALVHLIKGDMIQRFRPLFWLHRILEVKIFGVNFLCYSLYTFSLFVGTQLLFYFGLKRKGFSLFQIVLFLGVSFLGEPSVIWWELGPNETLSTFLLALSFYFMTSENKLLNRIVFSIVLAMSALSKESFAVIVPAFILLKYYFDCQINKKHFWRWITENKWVIFLLLVFTTTIVYILFFIQNSGSEFVGEESGLKALIIGVFSIFTSSLKSYVILVFSIFIFIYFAYRNEKKWMSFLMRLILPLLFVFLIICPNLILHFKTGIWNRYFVPTSIGIAFLVLFVLEEIKGELKWLYKFLLFVVSCFVLNLFVETYLMARNFTKEGWRNKEVLALATKHKSMLIVANPLLEYEWTVSLSLYLDTYTDVNYLFYPVEYSNQKSNYGSLELRQELESNWKTRFKNKLYNKEMNPTPLVLFLHPSESKILIDQLPGEYSNRIHNSTYSLYQLKK